MKKKIVLFFSLLTSMVSMAQVGTISPKEGSEIMPKPAFTITYNEDVPALSTVDARYRLRDAITIATKEKKYEYAIGEVTPRSINFILQDLEVLPPNTDVTITTSAELGSQTFSYKTENYYVLDKSKTSFDYVNSKNNTLYIAEGIKLLVDKTLKCKQLIVEPNAGITIAETGSLLVYDTAYFLPHIGELEGMPYLINKGSYQAAGTVFMRDLPDYRYLELSSPISQFSAYEFSVSNFYYDEDELGYFTYGDIFWGENISFDYYAWGDDKGKDIINNWAFYVLSYGENIMRMSGTLNSDEEYTLSRTAEYSYGASDDPTHWRNKATYLTRLPNVYSSYIDLRKMYEEGRLDAKNMYMKKNYNYINDEYVYNLNSGLTTYDGPMSYGYLLPQLSNAGDYTSKTINATETKEDQTTQAITRLTYTERDENNNYVDETPKYPYIRFYCNYVGQKALDRGKRSVCVLYFVKDSEEQAEMRTDINGHIGTETTGGNVKYDAVWAGESTDEEFTNYSYPYIVSRKLSASNRLPLSIGSYNYPTDEVNGVEVDLSVMAGTADEEEKIEIGVLDYYLPGLIFENADNEEETIELSRLNLSTRCEVKKELGEFKDSYWLYPVPGNLNLERTFTLRFRLPANDEERELAAQARYYDPESIEEIDPNVTEYSFASSGALPEPIVSTITYSINTDAEHGTITTSKSEAAAGEQIIIKATPDEDYYLKSISVISQKGNNIDIDDFNSFVMPNENVTITAEFASISNFAVTVSTDDNGLATASKYDAEEGDNITINYKPNDGYTLDAINTTPEVDDLSFNDNNTANFTMPNSNVAVNVTFKANTYNISVNNTDENGVILVDKSIAHVGDAIKIIALPKEGYKLTAIYINDVFDNNIADENNTFTMPAADVEITPIFALADDYWIYAKATPAEGGVVSVSTNDAEKDVEVTISATPAEGYNLIGITATTNTEGTDVEIADNKFTMPADNVVVEATFKAIDYNVVVVESTNGTVVASKEVANIGDEVTLTITPAAGYRLVSVTTTPELEIIDNKFIMPATDVTITATFAIGDAYNIKVVEPANGTVIADKQDATVGEEVTLTITPAEGYEFGSITTNPEVEITDNKFTMPAADVTISVTFNYVCKNIEVDNAITSIVDWVLVVANTELNNKGYTFDNANITWYKVVGAKDDWCTGTAQDDEKVGTGLYYSNGNEQIAEGEYYVVIALTTPANKFVVSNVISISGNKKLLLTPTAVKVGQTLHLSNLPTDDNTIVKVYNINGTVVSTIPTNGQKAITFQAEATDGVYIVNVYVGEYTQSLKYIVVK